MIEFGPFEVSQHGLSHRKTLLPWEKVSDVRMHDDTIIVRAQGKRLAWAKAPVSLMPNVFVFLALIEAIGQGIRDNKAISM